MKKLAFAVVLVMSSAGFVAQLSAQAAAPAAPAAAPGTPEAAKAYWAGATSLCRNCHGANGEGAFGPDLAGRGLNADEFKRAVRQPWGVMPAFVEGQLPDSTLEGLTAWFATMPKTAQVGQWFTRVPPSAPARQVLMISAGCGQCHGPELGVPRVDAGAEGADFAWFAKNVYEHTTNYPTGRMGNFSRLRVPESMLQEIWQYASVDLGLRARVVARVTGGTAEAGKTTYTITVTNTGVAGKGMAAETLTVSVALPAGATVVTTSPSGYQGVSRDAAANADAAVWTAPRLAAGDKIIYTLTLSGATAAPKGQVRWVKPTVDVANLTAGN